jgi:hypothetical protein
MTLALKTIAALESIPFCVLLIRSRIPLDPPYISIAPRVRRRTVASDSA